MIKEGTVFKGIGGLYTVKSENAFYECRAKGKFRYNKISPLAGDNVIISVNEGTDNTIDEIKERKNSLRRPPVANIDVLFIVVSTCQPVPSTLIIDRLTVICEKNEIEPVIVFSKSDIKPADELFDTYSNSGYKTVLNSSLDEIKSIINGRLCAFTGNSGVGKSTLLNLLEPSLRLQTDEISLKLGRGKHTTRQAEIFEICGGMVIDTAGFSSLDFGEKELVRKEDLQFCFPEFTEHLTSCRFTGCSHTNDMGCRIRELVDEGAISRSRHESYVLLYNEAKQKENQWK